MFRTTSHQCWHSDCLYKRKTTKEGVMGDNQTSGVKIKVSASFTEAPVEPNTEPPVKPNPVTQKFQPAPPQKVSNPPNPTTQTSQFFNISKPGVQKLFPNLNPTWTPPSNFWKDMMKLPPPLDVIQVRIDKGFEIFLLKDYPQFNKEKEYPLCDPLLRCAGTISLLRTVW